MGRRFTGEEVMESGRLHLLAEGLMGIEVVPQKGAPPGVNPAGGSPDLAILFGVTILGERRTPGEAARPGALRGPPEPG
jgi:hypothetical protein